jgi:hypothetical protein
MPEQPREPKPSQTTCFLHVFWPCFSPGAYSKHRVFVATSPRQAALSSTIKLCATSYIAAWATEPFERAWVSSKVVDSADCVRSIEGSLGSLPENQETDRLLAARIKESSILDCNLENPRYLCYCHCQQARLIRRKSSSYRGSERIESYSGKTLTQASNGLRSS